MCIVISKFKEDPKLYEPLKKFLSNQTNLVFIKHMFTNIETVEHR